ncbi:hypothetical protein GP486_000148 [Trichoglossum hirsutum]|uniref:Uncharacterized protein n=1 Tax=Trichoglossum hirsutum TaxID=265104 RepID=A0A9P8LJ29_9PEZI|nr:hypothetical protein GP486_000148 [Trichoglossum hirsutum]
MSTVGSIMNLTSSALDLINSTNPVHRIAHNIVGWLCREGIGESDFQYCIDRCRGLAYPNETGLQIREDIAKSQDKAARAGGLQLVTSGAIGRWMAFTQEHAYMVTTIATVTKFHDLDFATTLLCEMAMTDVGRPYNELSHSVSYTVDYARLQGVVSKIADSIYLNVVNAGHALGNLPEELQSLHVHVLPPQFVAFITLQISRYSKDMMLLCDFFYADLALWLLVHFQGVITLSVAGEQLFRKQSRCGNQQLKIVVRKACDGATCETPEQIEMCDDTFYDSIQLCDMLRGFHFIAERVLPSTKITNIQRQSLYSVMFPGATDLLKYDELSDIKKLAHRLVAWILDLQLNPDRPGWFKVELSESIHENQMRFSDVFCRWPGILNPKVLQKQKLKPLIFEPPEVGEVEVVNSTCDLYDTFVSCFPSLRDLMDQLSSRCKCRECRTEGSINNSKAGCLRWLALSQLLMLVGVAIADGFGVDDISGAFKPSDFTLLRNLISTVLYHLVNGTINWEGWFVIASSIALGFVPSNQLGQDTKGHLVAVQHGSLVVTAQWLDLSRRLRKNHCCALEVIEGQLSGAQRNTMFVRTKLNTQGGSSQKRELFQTFNLVDNNFLEEVSREDLCECSLVYCLTGSTEPGLVNLVILVSSGSSERILNPTDVLHGVLRSRYISKVECNHRPARDVGAKGETKKDTKGIENGDNSSDEWEDVDENEHDDAMTVWTFEQLMARWGPFRPGEILFTKCLDTELKLNVALGLGRCQAVIRETKCCMACALESLDPERGKSPCVISFQIDDKSCIVTTKL